MKFRLFIAFVLLATALPAAGIAKRDTFQRKIDRINANLASYDSLNPWTVADDPSEKIIALQNVIISGLLEVLSDPNILKYDLGKTFPGEALGHAHSPDERVHFFTIDQKTGGSFRSNITIIHTVDSLNKVHAELLPEDLNYFAYYNVVQLDAKRQLYLALGSVITCNTCIAQTAITINAAASPIAESFVGVDCRTSLLYEFDFIDSTRTLNYHFAYVEEEHDLYAEFYEEDDANAVNKYIVRHESAAYSFHNGRFVQTSECWFIEERVW